MLRVRFPTKMRTDFTLCPTGCTQKRTIDYRLSERNTFDGTECKNCGFKVRKGSHRVVFQKFHL